MSINAERVTEVSEKIKSNNQFPTGIMFVNALMVNIDCIIFMIKDLNKTIQTSKR